MYCMEGQIKIASLNLSITFDKFIGASSLVGGSAVPPYFPYSFVRIEALLIYLPLLSAGSPDVLSIAQLRINKKAILREARVYQFP